MSKQFWIDRWKQDERNGEYYEIKYMVLETKPAIAIGEIFHVQEVVPGTVTIPEDEYKELLTLKAAYENYEL